MFLPGMVAIQSAAACRLPRRLPVPSLYFLLQLESAEPASDDVIGKHFGQCIFVSFEVELLA
jgi:hypothetical protein